MSIIKPIYLDNAATSHPKPESVYLAVMETLRAGGSSGRGTYQQTLAAERIIFETRESLAEYSIFRFATSRTNHGLY